MFERFTEKAIEVIMYAQEESRRLGHNLVGTEQLLLALIRQESTITAKVLQAMGITLENARIEVEKIIGKGSGLVAVEIPFTSDGKQVLENSLAECRQLGQNRITTEHLLLGIILQGQGVAIQVLENFDIDPLELYNQIIRELSIDNNSSAERTLSVVTKSPRIENLIDQLSGILASAQSLISEIEREFQGIPVSLEDIAEAINQLPDSPEPNQPGIKELLAQLYTVIEADNDLNAEDKAETFEQILVLAEAGQNPTAQRIQKSARTALKILRGTLTELPAESQLVVECNQLLSAIAQLFNS